MAWEPHLLFFSAKTSTINSLVAQDHASRNLAGFTQKFYDASEVEVTSGSDIATRSTKMVVDMELPQDYLIKGGAIMQRPRPDTSVWASVVGAPGISSDFGGSINFLNRNDLYYLPEYFDFENVEETQMKYDPVNHGSLVRFTFEYGASVVHGFQVALKIRK
jgi:hypothetical protein